MTNEFNYYDEDHDGNLSKKELDHLTNVLLEVIGYGKHARAFITSDARGAKFMDVNRDGQTTSEEFVQRYLELIEVYVG